MSQRMDALDRANEIRSERARLKRGVLDGEIDVVDLIIDPPDCIQKRKTGQKVPSVAELLAWQRRWGMMRAAKFLSPYGITQTILPQNLSFVSKVKIARGLQENIERNIRVMERRAAA